MPGPLTSTHCLVVFDSNHVRELGDNEVLDLNGAIHSPCAVEPLGSIYDAKVEVISSGGSTVQFVVHTWEVIWDSARPTWQWFTTVAGSHQAFATPAFSKNVFPEPVPTMPPMQGHPGWRATVRFTYPDAGNTPTRPNAIDVYAFDGTRVSGAAAGDGTPVPAYVRGGFKRLGGYSFNARALYFARF